MSRDSAKHEARLALAHACVSALGFLVDAFVLKLALSRGLEPAWARVVSLVCAMNVTFAVNGLLVFRCLRRCSLPHQWFGYMAANALGNFFNYFIFVAFVSSRWPVISLPIVALASGSIVAWIINYTTTRLVVFGKALAARRREAGLDSSPGATTMD